MAVTALNVLEQKIADIKLVPKMILLMIFSTVLILAKVAFDAQQIKTQISKQQGHELTQKITLAEGVVRTAYEQQAILGGEEQAKAFALETLANMKWANNGHIWVLQQDGVALLFPGQSNLEGRKAFSAFDGVQQQLELSAGNGQGLLNTKIGNEAVTVATQGFELWSWSLAAAVDSQAADAVYWGVIQRGVMETVILIVVFVILLIWVARLMLKQVNAVTVGLEALANKDLTEHVQLTCNDEFGSIASGIRTTVANWKALLQQQNISSEELLDISDQLTVCMEAVQESIEEEFSQVEDLATAMNQMTSSVKEVASSAATASTSTIEANQVALEGNSYVESTIGTINSLSSNIDESSKAVNQVEEKVSSIGSVVDTIRGISEQTNLLALNAAIEAARAGEQGRGFAVVADEVRNLAQRTQEATVEIQQMIEQLQRSASQAVSLMSTSVEEANHSVEQVGKAGNKIDFIAGQVQSIADLNNQIASASEEQSCVAQEMNGNINEVKELVEGSVTVLKELNEMAGIIATHSHALANEIKSFKVS